MEDDEVMDNYGFLVNLRGSTLIQDSIIMPSQWGAGPRTKWWEQLMWAVLENAWHCAIKGHAHQHTRYGRRILVEEMLWVESHDTSWPFAFENICVSLGLDPGTWRKAFARACPDTLPISEKERNLFLGITPAYTETPNFWDHWRALKRYRIRTLQHTCELCQQKIPLKAFYRRAPDGPVVRIACEVCLKQR